MKLATRWMNEGDPGEANVHLRHQPDSTRGINSRGRHRRDATRRRQRADRSSDRNGGSYLKRGRCGVVAVGVDFRDSSLRDKMLVRMGQGVGIGLGKGIGWD